MSQQIKYPVTNQYINMLVTKKDQSFPPRLAEFCPVNKSLINKAEDDRNDSTDTSRTDKEYFVDNLKAMNNKYIYYKYKLKNSHHQHINENVINKTK